VISDSKMNDAPAGADQPVASIASSAEVLPFPSGTAHAANRSPNHSVAVRLAQAGLPIFPARLVRNETTGRWDKVPLVPWRKVATSDLGQINEWWDAYPDAVPGIELGRVGLMVIDADRHGGPDGVAALEALAAANAPLPHGPITVTAGGGRHAIFRQPEGQRLAIDAAPCHQVSMFVAMEVGSLDRGPSGPMVRHGQARQTLQRWTRHSAIPKSRWFRLGSSLSSNASRRSTARAARRVRRRIEDAPMRARH
jgi:Bifunctional DNA primase/polymerase, N-terminal